jgi:hypothetical protein
VFALSFGKHGWLCRAMMMTTRRRLLVAKLSVAELQEMARATFGRELSEAQAEAYRGRLPTMVRIVQRLRALEPRLRDAHPVQIAQVPEPRRHE